MFCFFAKFQWEPFAFRAFQSNKNIQKPHPRHRQPYIVDKPPRTTGYHSTKCHQRLLQQRERVGFCYSGFLASVAFAILDGWKMFGRRLFENDENWNNVGMDERGNELTEKRRVDFYATWPSDPRCFRDQLKRKKEGITKLKTKERNWKLGHGDWTTRHLHLQIAIGTSIYIERTEGWHNI